MLQIICISLLFTIFNIFGHTNETPPYTGEDLTGTGNGKGNVRAGTAVRTNNWLYDARSFDEWHKKRGFVDPSGTFGLLCNPYRIDGTSLSYNIGIPNNFTGHIPVYSKGNLWPYVGALQPAPNYKNLDEDAGIYYKNGTRIQTVEPLFVKGSGVGPILINKTPYSIVLTVGNFPGNEQPGQCITPVNPGDTVRTPVPPQGWWNDAIPELYASVAGLHPLDIHGWHYSSHGPIYPGGIGMPDFGTPGYAYTLNTKHGTSSFLPHYLWGGLNSNEGYDPIVSGDPGYGIAFYLDGVLQGVIDISPDVNNPYVADATVVALTAHNPHEGDAGFGATQLKCMPVYDSAVKSAYVLLTHAEAQALITSMKNDGHPSAYKQYKSNPNAVVENLPLPEVIPGDTTTEISSTLSLQKSEHFQISHHRIKGYIKVKTNSPGVISIYSVNGKIMIQRLVKESSKLLNLGKIIPGVYIVKFSSSSSTTASRFVLSN